MMATNDYIVVAPNRRGLPGFGKEWNEEISGDYGGQCMKDYLSAIDEMAKIYVNADKLGCIGASWEASLFIGLPDITTSVSKHLLLTMVSLTWNSNLLETEEMWFANWDMGGAYWDKNNATAQRTFANSPHKFVDKWDTPILCIHKRTQNPCFTRYVCFQCSQTKRRSCTVAYLS